MTYRHAGLLLGALLVLGGCDGEKSPEDDSAEEDKKKKKKKKKKEQEQAETQPAAAPVLKELPSPADLKKMTWTEGDTARTLIDTELSKRCLMKGVKIVLPEGAPLEPLMGTRGCVIRAWGGTKGPYLFLASDELPLKMPPRDEIKDLKQVVEETDDSWIAEFKDKKTGFSGRLTRKFGKRTYYCVANANGVGNLEFVRGMMKLCSSLTETNNEGTKDAEGSAGSKSAGHPKPFNKKKHAQQQNDKLKGMFGK